MSDPVTPLTPPAPSAELTLTPPAPVAAVAPEKVGGMVAGRRRPRCPASTPRSPSYVDELMAARRRTRPRSRPRPATSARWATRRSAAPPRRRTACSRRRCRAMSAAASRRRSRSPRRCSSCAARSRTSTRPRRRASRSCSASSRSATRSRDYFRQVRERAEAPRRHHQGALRRPGRAAQGQRRPRAGEGAPVGDDAAARPVHLHRRAARRRARREDRRGRGDRPRAGQGAARGRAVLRPPEAPGPAHPAGGVDPGLPGDRPRAQEQHRADQGCRPGDDDDDRRAAHRGDRRPGARQPEARARPDHRAEHDDVEDDRVDLEDARDPERRHPRSRRRRRRSASSRCRRRSRTSTRRWTRSTRSRSQALDVDGHDDHRPRDRGRQGAGVPRPGAASGRPRRPPAASTSAAESHADAPHVPGASSRCADALRHRRRRRGLGRGGRASRPPRLVVAGACRPSPPPALAVAARRRGAGPRGGTWQPAPPPPDPPEPDLRRPLDRRRARWWPSKVPPAVEARVRRIAGTVRDTLPRLDQLRRGSSHAHTRSCSTATSYLPEAVGAYMRLPAQLRRPPRRSRAARRR